MQNPPPLAGLDPADLLRQGAADDTFVDGASSAFVPPPLEEIAAVFPQFEILELIGQGGMGAVYKVHQKDLDRIVALKILPPGIGQTPEFSKRFTREARALAKLNHPGIVTLHEFGQQDGLYFILMEFVDGVNLAQLMKTGRVSPREALAIVPQICDALQYAHDQGIVHRDIKPENLLLDRAGRVKVADFGIAKVVAAVCDRRTSEDDNQRRSQTDATLAGKIIGTPQYMAPEQIEHPSDVDHRADIYALGVVFYQMLTGELPGKDLQAPSLKVHIDVRLDEIVLKAMEKNPELRYQQASVMRTRVDDLRTVFPQNAPSRIGTSIPNENDARTEPFAITSLILGICSLILWPLAALPAIVFGHLARCRIRKNPALKGNGFAIAGLSLGYFFIMVSVVLLILLVLNLKYRNLAIQEAHDARSISHAEAGDTNQLPKKDDADSGSPDGKKIGALAVTWLAGIDAGDYARSWKEAADFFRNAITEDGWNEALTKFRKPLGAVKSRTLLDAKNYKSLPGAPDGEYVVMGFETSFSAKEKTVETVTFMKQPDGTWKAAGYFIR